MQTAELRELPRRVTILKEKDCLIPVIDTSGESVIVGVIDGKCPEVWVEEVLCPYCGRSLARVYFRNSCGLEVEYVEKVSDCEHFEVVKVTSYYLYNTEEGAELHARAVEVISDRHDEKLVIVPRL